MTFADTGKTFTTTYPRLLKGACMHCVRPSEPERAFEKTEMTLPLDADFPPGIGYSPSCVRVYEMGTLMTYDCSCPWPHGHVMMECDDGIAWITAPVASQAMIEEIIKELPRANFSPAETAEMARMLRELTKHILPVEMSKDEQAYLGNLNGNRKSLGPMGWFG